MDISVDELTQKINQFALENAALTQEKIKITDIIKAHLQLVAIEVELNIIQWLPDFIRRYQFYYRANQLKKDKKKYLQSCYQYLFSHLEINVNEVFFTKKSIQFKISDFQQTLIKINAMNTLFRWIYILFKPGIRKARQEYSEYIKKRIQQKSTKLIHEASMFPSMTRTRLKSNVKPTIQESLQEIKERLGLIRDKYVAEIDSLVNNACMNHDVTDELIISLDENLNIIIKLFEFNSKEIIKFADPLYIESLTKERDSLLQMLQQIRSKSEVFVNIWNKYRMTYILQMIKQRVAFSEGLNEKQISELKDFLKQYIILKKQLKEAKNGPVILDWLVFRINQSLANTKITNLEGTIQDLINPKPIVEASASSVSSSNTSSNILDEMIEKLGSDNFDLNQLEDYRKRDPNEAYKIHLDFIAKQYSIIQALRRDFSESKISAQEFHSRRKKLCLEIHPDKVSEPLKPIATVLTQILMGIDINKAPIPNQEEIDGLIFMKIVETFLANMDELEKSVLSKEHSDKTPENINKEARIIIQKFSKSATDFIYSKPRNRDEKRDYSIVLTHGIKLLLERQSLINLNLEQQRKLEQLELERHQIEQERQQLEQEKQHLKQREQQFEQIGRDGGEAASSVNDVYTPRI